MPKNPQLPNPLAAAFSRWLSQTRKSLGISRYTIAKGGHVSESNLKALEDNAHDPKLSTFVAACRALGKRPGKVLTDLLKETDTTAKGGAE